MTTGEIRDYWEADAATYDGSAGHHPRTSAELATWRRTLSRLLPPAPAAVLDAGAGTGFLSLLLAELGYDVTAVDVSSAMLERLRFKAASASLSVSVVEADATSPPRGPFDAVVERHLLWTMPDPIAALAAWRAAAPGGRLVLVESLWGSSAQALDAVRVRARGALARARRTPPAHHAEYGDALRSGLPLAHGPTPAELIDLVVASGWGPVRMHRLPDVEWAVRLALPPLDRLLGVTPRYAVVAGS